MNAINDRNTTVPEANIYYKVINIFDILIFEHGEEFKERSDAEQEELNDRV